MVFILDVLDGKLSFWTNHFDLPKFNKISFPSQSALKSNHSTVPKQIVKGVVEIIFWKFLGPYKIFWKLLGLIKSAPGH